LPKAGKIDSIDTKLRLKNLSEATKKSYLCCYNQFKKYIGRKEITKELIEQYLLKSKSRRNNIAMLRLICYELVKDIKFPKRQYKPKILPAKADLKIFYDALPDKYKPVFLLLAESGLRIGELLNADIDKTNKMIIPKSHDGQTKHSWISFYNTENSIPQVSASRVSKSFKETSDKTGIKIYPHLLRSVFAREMSKAGVQDRYIDAFCGRVPGSVLARHYSDFSPEVLKEIYSKANIKILE